MSVEAEVGGAGDHAAGSTKANGRSFGLAGRFDRFTNYVPFVRAGGLVSMSVEERFLSGQGPIGPDGTLMTGKVGAEVDTAEAARHARLTGLGLLAAMREAAGGFDKLTRVVKLLGMVNAVPDYGDHPMVINGCSDLMVEVLGERGKHARSAVGMGSLPLGITVEIEAVIEVA